MPQLQFVPLRLSGIVVVKSGMMGHSSFPTLEVSLFNVASRSVQTSPGYLFMEQLLIVFPLQTVIFVHGNRSQQLRSLGAFHTVSM